MGDFVCPHNSWAQVWHNLEFFHCHPAGKREKSVVYDWGLWHKDPGFEMEKDKRKEDS